MPPSVPGGSVHPRPPTNRSSLSACLRQPPAAHQRAQALAEGGGPAGASLDAAGAAELERLREALAQMEQLESECAAPLASTFSPAPVLAFTPPRAQSLTGPHLSWPPSVCACLPARSWELQRQALIEESAEERSRLLEQLEVRTGNETTASISARSLITLLRSTALPA